VYFVFGLFFVTVTDKLTNQLINQPVNGLNDQESHPIPMLALTLRTEDMGYNLFDLAESHCT